MSAKVRSLLCAAFIPCAERNSNVSSPSETLICRLPGSHSTFVLMVAVSYKPFSDRFRILKGMTGERTAGKLQGKIALVTGGSLRIGFATAKQFIGEGAFVYIAGHRQTELDRALTTLGVQTKSVRADASKLEDLDALYAQIQQEKGRLDVPIVNAGRGSFAPLGQITEEQFDEVPSHEAGPTILKIGRFRVNVVSPGPVDTQGLSGLAQTEEHKQVLYAQLASDVPLGPPWTAELDRECGGPSRLRKTQASSSALNSSLTVAPPRSDVRDSVKRSMEKKR